MEAQSYEDGDLVNLHVGFVTGHARPPAGDLPLIDHLRDEGAVVSTLHDEQAGSTCFGGFDVLFVSTSVLPSDLGGALDDLAVPIVTNEHLLLDDLAMAAAPIGQRTASHIRIVDETDPMAAGFVGNIRITDPATPIGFGTPAPSARIAAEFRGLPVLFGYDAGDQMIDDVVAPAATSCAKGQTCGSSISISR